MHHHLEFEEKRETHCAGCGAPIRKMGVRLCSTCSTSVQDFSSGSDNPLLTQSSMPGTVDQDIDDESDGSDEEILAVANKIRISYHSDFEGVVLRHAEFERAVQACLRKGIDLDKRIKSYEATIKSAANKFWSSFKYRPVLAANSYNEKDLYSFGRAWATIYIGLYEKPGSTDTDPGVENNKLMYRHIIQKCTEFVGTLYKKQKDVIPHREVGVGFSLSDFSTKLGRPVDLPSKPVGQGTTQVPDVGTACNDPSWRRKHNKLSLSNDAARRRDAKRLLGENLASMSHEEIHKLLMATADNDANCPDSRRQAKKLAAKVKACMDKPDLPLEKRCSVCKIRNRPADRTNLGYPQANSLKLVRAYTLSLMRGQRPFVESLGAVSVEALARHTAYYRHAARVLGFAAENRDGSTSPTKFAYDLAETKVGSIEERELFHERILVSPSMKDTAWFFQTLEQVPGYILAEDIMQAASRRPGFDHVNPKTANRRVSTLIQWKLYVMSDLIASEMPEQVTEIADELSELRRIEESVKEE